MKFPAIFLILLLVASFVSTFKLRGLRNDTLQQQLWQEKEAGNYSRISNGQDATQGQFGYQVCLRSWYSGGGDLTCGGSLIDHGWVLTAAHCTIDAISISVYIGSVRLHEGQIVYLIYRSDIIQHDEFHRNTFVNDIALIRIPPIRPLRDVVTARLPTRVPNLPPYVGYTTILAGWGVTSDSSNGPFHTLQYAIFQTISNPKCAEVYGEEKIYKGKICTATFDQISGCPGDSGSPLVFLTGNIQIGIFSFGWSGGCEMGYPNTFTRVDFYLEWIHEKSHLPV